MKKCFVLISLLFVSSSVFSQWQRVYSGYHDDIHSIQLIDNLVFASGQNGFFVYSRDTGKSWTKKTLPIPSNIRTMWFFDSLTGLVIGENCRVQRTTDAGKNWQQTYARVASYAYGVHFQGAYGIMVGKDLFAATSLDSGKTWTPDTTEMISKSLQDVAISPGGRCWAVGDSGYILNRSKNSGKWNVSRYNSTINLTNISILSESHIVISGGMQIEDMVGVHLNIILYSTDTGKTWNASSVDEMKTIYDAAFLSEDSGILVGSNGLTARVNHPLNSRKQLVSGTSSGLSSVSLNHDIAFVAGDGGTILKSKNLGGWGVSIRELSTQKPIIYPNPASIHSGSTTITLDDKLSLETVRVFDLNGKSIEIKVEGSKVKLLNVVSGTYVLYITGKKGITSASTLILE